MSLAGTRMALGQGPSPDVPVETSVHTYGPFRLRPNEIQQMPPRLEVLFPADVWLVGYKVEMIDTSGEALPQELQCHTFLGNRIPHQLDNAEHPLFAIYSDGYTSELDLPPGFGIPFQAHQKLLWMSMFNNRGSLPFEVKMRATFRTVPAAKASGSLKILYATVRSVATPNMYYAKPGVSRRESEFSLPAPGKIHVMGTHIHPHGVSIELLNLTKNHRVWKAEAQTVEGRLASMPVYKNGPGYPIEPGGRFKLIATYDNPTDGKIDAMAGLYIFYSTD